MIASTILHIYSVDHIRFIFTYRFVLSMIYMTLHGLIQHSIYVHDIDLSSFRRMRKYTVSTKDNFLLPAFVRIVIVNGNDTQKIIH